MSRPQDEKDYEVLVAAMSGLDENSPAREALTAAIEAVKTRIQLSHDINLLSKTLDELPEDSVVREAVLATLEKLQADAPAEALSQARDNSSLKSKTIDPIFQLLARSQLPRPNLGTGTWPAIALSALAIMGFLLTWFDLGLLRLSGLDLARIAITSDRINENFLLGTASTSFIFLLIGGGAIFAIALTSLLLSSVLASDSRPAIGFVSGTIVLIVPIGLITLASDLGSSSSTGAWPFSFIEILESGFWMFFTATAILTGIQARNLAQDAAAGQIREIIVLFSAAAFVSVAVRATPQQTYEWALLAVLTCLILVAARLSTVTRFTFLIIPAVLVIPQLVEIQSLAVIIGLGTTVWTTLLLSLLAVPRNALQAESSGPMNKTPRNTKTKQLPLFRILKKASVVSLYASWYASCRNLIAALRPQHRNHSRTAQPESDGQRTRKIFSRPGLIVGLMLSALTTIAYSLDAKSVPNVIGQDAATATQTVRDAGFDATLIVEPTMDHAEGEVFNQAPQGRARRGSSISLTVAERATHSLSGQIQLFVDIRRVDFGPPTYLRNCFSRDLAIRQGTELTVHSGGDNPEILGIGRLSRGTMRRGQPAITRYNPQSPLMRENVYAEHCSFDFEIPNLKASYEYWVDLGPHRNIEWRKHEHMNESNWAWTIQIG